MHSQTSFSLLRSYLLLMILLSMFFFGKLSGAIISQRKVSVSDDIKLPELTEQLSDIGADMLVDCLKTLPKSIENAQPQSAEGVTHGNTKKYQLIHIEQMALNRPTCWILVRVFLSRQLLNKKIYLTCAVSLLGKGLPTITILRDLPPSSFKGVKIVLPELLTAIFFPTAKSLTAP